MLDSSYHMTAGPANPMPTIFELKGNWVLKQKERHA